MPLDFTLNGCEPLVMQLYVPDQAQAIISKRTLILYSWAKQNGALEKIFNYDCFKPYLDSLNIVEIEESIQNLGSFSENLTIDEVDSLFEGFHSKETREKLGITYTPPAIREYLIKQSFELFPMKRIPTFCDPACGSGGFLYKAAKHYKEKFGIPIRQSLSDYIYGFDVDSLSVENSKLILFLACVESGESPDNLIINITTLDSLIDETPHKKFDIVCTNPPYVKLQNLPEAYRHKLQDLYADIAKGSYSLSMLFLKRGMDMLSEHGILSYITQNNLFTSNSAKSLRALIQPHLCKVVNFGQDKVFIGVGAYTCLLFLTKDTRNEFSYSNIDYKSNIIDFNSNESLIPNEALNPIKWRLASKKHLANIIRIESQPNILGEITNIRVGLATLSDKVFVVYENDKRCFASSSMGAVEIEKGITVPAIKIADINSPDDLAHNTTRIIFPYMEIGKKFQPLPEDEFMQSFPGTYAYLTLHKKRLLSRDKGKGNTIWYAWGRTQGMKASGPKLLTKTFNNKPQFFLDTTNSLFFNGYAVFPCAIDIHVLSRVLNSRVMHYYAKLTSFEIEGNYQCYQKNFIERFGLPDLSLINNIMTLEDMLFEDKLIEAYGLDKSDIDEILTKQ